MIGGDTRIARAKISAQISDLFGVPAIDGTLSANTIRAAGLTVDTLSAEARTKGAATSFSAKAALDNGAELATSGSLAPVETGVPAGARDVDTRSGQAVRASCRWHLGDTD